MATVRKAAPLGLLLSAHLFKFLVRAFGRWQYNDTASISGFPGEQPDVDVFNGSSSDMIATLVVASSTSFSVTLSASPSAGGMVSGDGTFASGSSRTVTATANNGYTFANWTENGSVVSSSGKLYFHTQCQSDFNRQFHSGGTTPSVTSPIPGSTLTSSSATFQWSSGSGV